MSNKNRNPAAMAVMSGCGIFVIQKRCRQAANAARFVKTLQGLPAFAKMAEQQIYKDQDPGGCQGTKKQHGSAR